MPWSVQYFVGRMVPRAELSSIGGCRRCESPGLAERSRGDALELILSRKRIRGDDDQEAEGAASGALLRTSFAAVLRIVTP